MRLSDTKKERLQAMAGDEERTIDFVPAYSGGKLYTAGIYSPEPVSIDGVEYPQGTVLPCVVNLQTIQLRDNIPILYMHDQLLRLGHTETVKTDGRTIEVTGKLSSPSQWKTEVVEGWRAGAEWQCSIGCGEIAPEQKTFHAAGDVVEINGQRLEGPFVELNGVHLIEISVVPAGADPRTEVLIASSGGMNMTFEAFCQRFGFDLSTLDEVNRAALRALWEAKAEGEEKAPEETEEVKEEAKEELKEEVLEAEGDSEKKEDELKAEGETEDEEEKKKESLTAGAARARSFMSSLNVPTGKPVQRQSVARSEVLEASALLQSGVDPEWLASRKGGGYSRATVDAADAEGEITLTEMMRESLRAAGLDGGKNARQTQKLFAKAHREFLFAASPSTSKMDAVNIFSNVIDKKLRREFELRKPMYFDLLESRPVSDLKEVTTVDWELNGTATTVLEGENFPEAMLTSGGKKYSVTRSGLKVSLSWEAQVNDDLSALSKVPSKIVEAVLHDFNLAFWKLWWSQNSTIYTSGKKNKITKALSIDGISAANVALQSLKLANGQFMNVPGKFLLVPFALEATAQNIYFWPWAGENNTKGNLYKGRYEVLTDPYLGSQGGISGASDTGWFMIADPAIYPLGERAFLRDQNAPQVVEKKFDSKDALEFRAFGTQGVCLYDKYTPAVYSTGAGG